MSPPKDASRTSPPSQVLTTAMAAEPLQVDAEHLRRLVREGKVPCHRLPGGREMRFLRGELMEWPRAQPGEKPGRGQLAVPSRALRGVGSPLESRLVQVLPLGGVGVKVWCNA